MHGGLSPELVTQGLEIIPQRIQRPCSIPEGGLMCDLMIDDYGFPAMVRLLEAFNEGKDLDGALDAAYGLTPLQPSTVECRWAPRLGMRRISTPSFSRSMPTPHACRC